MMRSARITPWLTRHAWAVLTSVVAALIGFVLARRAWTLHSGYQTDGFDLGIFAQGTWLLAHLQSPFVTVRGLNLFGDHASYVLVLLAPFYRLWPDPRLLLMVQAFMLLLPSLVAYRIGAKLLGKPAGAAVAIAYLLYPAMQWPVVWQFHPEALAAGFLALALLAADRLSFRWMSLWLALAMLCKEDVSFVVFGFGALLFLNHQRRAGARVMVAAAVYFFVAAFVIIPWINGQGSLYFHRNYGIDGSGPVLVLMAAPVLLWHAVQQSVSDAGLLYLMLVFGPFAMLPLLGGRWLLPAAGPLLLNLASKVPYQHRIEYQYLATSAPFLVIAAVMGLHRLKRSGWRVKPALLVLLVVAGTLSVARGPAEDTWNNRHLSAAKYPEFTAALDLIPSGAAVSAEYDLVTHLTDRNNVYEFPNPFQAANWGLTGGGPIPQWRVASVQYVVVKRTSIGPEDGKVLDRLEKSCQWSNIYDMRQVVVLQREPGPGRASGSGGLQCNP